MNKAIIQQITPHLWFDNNAEEAARFYTSIFKNSKIKNVTTLQNTPSGTAEIFTIYTSSCFSSQFTHFSQKESYFRSDIIAGPSEFG
jgi:predicted 3-demethylubiquinone-9 3-methyltransferase (glyoxalase superfamily)